MRFLQDCHVEVLGFPGDSLRYDWGTFSPVCRSDVVPPFSASGRERQNAGIGGERWRPSRRCGSTRGRAQGVVVHSQRQARMRRDAAQRRLSAECGMARARQKCGRDEFEKYDWWRKVHSRTNRLHLWTRCTSSILSAGGRGFCGPRCQRFCPFTVPTRTVSRPSLKDGACSRLPDRRPKSSQQRQGRHSQVAVRAWHSRVRDRSVQAATGRQKEQCSRRMYRHSPARWSGIAVRGSGMPVSPASSHVAPTASRSDGEARECVVQAGGQISAWVGPRSTV
jgi:hypothetical protein